MNFERVYHYIVIIDSIMKHTAKKRNTPRNTRRNTRRRHPPQADMTLVEKQSLSRKIREYSFDDIVEDYKQLVQIGCHAKDQSNKKYTGNRVVDAFTFTERLNTVGTKGISFYQFWKNREFYSRKNYVKKYISFANKQHRQTTEKMWYNLYRFYFTSINCFRPLVAMEYYCMFSPKCVLDMTAGWGGRLVGACALNIPNYIGIDNNLNLKEPYNQLVAFLQPHTKTNIDIRIQDALTVDYSQMKYDMVFTSPPYYDLEQYVEKSGLHFEKIQTKEQRKDEWDNTFYKPLFRSTYDHMEKGGHYCLNIPVEIFERVCLHLLGEPWKKFPLKKSDRRLNSDNKYVEYVYVWKKQ